MRVRKKDHLGQATVELALLLPILFGLLYWVILAFRTNHDSSDHSIRLHAQALRAFNHGNSGAVVVDGVEIVPGRYSEIIPPGAGWNPGDILKSAVPALGLQLGLNQLLSHAGFLNGESYVSGFARGFTTGAASSWVGSGFKDVNLESALWQGAAGALSSAEASQDFGRLGVNDYGPQLQSTYLKDFWGSAAQAGLVAFAASEGDWRQSVPGAVGGMFAARSSQHWLTFGGNDVLGGAAKGAITSAVAGVFSGNFNARNVLTSSAMGIVGSRTVAAAFGGAGSAAYGAARGAAGTLIQGGSLEAAAYAAAGGAFFSADVMGAVSGGNPWAAAGEGMAFNAGMAYLRGEEGAAVAGGALQGAVGGAVSAAQSRAYQELKKRMRGADTAEQANERLNEPEASEAWVRASEAGTAELHWIPDETQSAPAVAAVVP